MKGRRIGGREMRERRKFNKGEKGIQEQVTVQREERESESREEKGRKGFNNGSMKGRVGRSTQIPSPLLEPLPNGAK